MNVLKFFFVHIFFRLFFSVVFILYEKLIAQRNEKKCRRAFVALCITVFDEDMHF